MQRLVPEPACVERLTAGAATVNVVSARGTSPLADRADREVEMSSKTHAEMVKNLKLFRLASRELEGVSASCEMFFSNAVHDGEGDRMRRLSNEFAKIQEKADKLRARLDRDLEAFEGIEINEIY